MRVLTIISLLLIVIGALNWGLVGFFNYDLVRVIFGDMISRYIFALVGLAGIFGIFVLGRLWEKRDDVCVPGHRAVVSST